MCLAGWGNDNPIPLFPLYAPLAQQVSEHRPFKAGVLGSNPRRRTNIVIIAQPVSPCALGEIPRDRPLRGANKVLQLELSGNRIA